MPKIDLRGQSVNYSVRSSKRARRILICYGREKGLEVVYPAGKRQRPPQEVLQEEADWVLAAIDKMRQRRAQSPPRTYKEGEIFFIRGAPHALKLCQEPQLRRPRARQAEGALIVAASDLATLADKRNIQQAVENFYRQLAHAYLPPRVDELAALHGFQYNRLYIKNQKTRWGSCSAKRNINLNLRLMMAPAAAIDYVILHELCHLRQLNHSPAFWALLESCCPDYQHWRAWFKQQGATLIL